MSCISASSAYGLFSSLNALFYIFKIRMGDNEIIDFLFKFEIAILLVTKEVEKCSIQSLPTGISNRASI